MTHGAYTHRHFPSGERGRQNRNPVFPVFLCAAGLTLSSLAGLWILYSCPTDAPLSAGAPTAAAFPALPAATPPAIQPLRRYAGLLDPAFTSGYRPVAFAQIASLRSSVDHTGQAKPDPADQASAPAIEPSIAAPRAAEAELVPPPSGEAEARQTIPLPTPRPATLLQTRANVAQNSGATPPGTGTGIRPDSASYQTIFDKLFGTAQPPGPALAYAAPEEKSVRSAVKTALARPLYDGSTAVYDIAAHTVYLPDGTRLEAHSGLGSRLDDPRGVAERMRGATPPNIYQLELRAQLFHGVRALRLTPVGDKPTYGRAGLLAHTYMLGSRGDSNGCVAFKNY